MMLKFAASAPPVHLSPSKKDTILGQCDHLPSPSPISKSKRVALKDPSKKNLKEFEKNLTSHESAVKKGLQDLDKATTQFREVFEARVEMERRLQERLKRKQKQHDDAAERGRRRLYIHCLMIATILLLIKVNIPQLHRHYKIHDLEGQEQKTLNRNCSVRMKMTSLTTQVKTLKAL